MLTKYRYLAFYDRDNKVTCTVCPKKLEWVKKTQGMKGSRNRWALLGTHPDIDDDYKIKPFEISDLVICLIVSTLQAPGVHLLQQDDGDAEEDEEEEEEDMMVAGIGGDQDMF